MTNDECIIVYKAIKKSISGNAPYSITKSINRITSELWEDYNISYTDIVNDIYIKVIEDNLVDRLNDGLGLDCFINGVVLNMLRNMLVTQKDRGKITIPIIKDVDLHTSNKDIENSVIVEEGFDIINSMINNDSDEYRLLTGETTIEEFAKSKDVSISTIERLKRDLCAKLREVLNKNGYTKSFI